MTSADVHIQVSLSAREPPMVCSPVLAGGPPQTRSGRVVAPEQVQRKVNEPANCVVLGIDCLIHGNRVKVFICGFYGLKRTLHCRLLSTIPPICTLAHGRWTTLYIWNSFVFIGIWKVYIILFFTNFPLILPILLEGECWKSISYGFRQ